MVVCVVVRICRRGLVRSGFSRWLACRTAKSQVSGNRFPGSYAGCGVVSGLCQFGFAAMGAWHRVVREASPRNWPRACSLVLRAIPASAMDVAPEEARSYCVRVGGVGCRGIFTRSRWTVTFVPFLAGYSVLLLLPGLFWLWTAKLGWPPLLRTRPRSHSKRVLAFVRTCVVIFCLDVVLTVVVCGLSTGLFSGDCRGKPPFLHPLSPRQAVFTAKVLFAARSFHAMLGVGGSFNPPGPDRKVGDWAIGIIQERFWGMPRWTRLVLLTNYVYWEGETYFVDGYRFNGLLTQFLPIAEGGINCSRTKLAEEAIVDLRLLQKRPPEGSRRIVGYVRKSDNLSSALVRPAKPIFIAGAQINVIGPAGNTTVTTDSSGVYELDDPTPGAYTLQLSGQESIGEFVPWQRGALREFHLGSAGVVEQNFWLLPPGRR
jgi:hypothetical protein